jgi:hypothetical protein
MAFFSSFTLRGFAVTSNTDGSIGLCFLESLKANSPFIIQQKFLTCGAQEMLSSRLL